MGHKKAIQKILQALPKRGGTYIDDLLEQRTDASSPRMAKIEWSVVAVNAVQRYPYGSVKKWGKDPRYTKWLVIIKGVTIDTKERSRPRRYDDPWQKCNSSSRSRKSFSHSVSHIPRC